MRRVHYSPVLSVVYLLKSSWQRFAEPSAWVYPGSNNGTWATEVLQERFDSSRFSVDAQPGLVV